MSDFDIEIRVGSLTPGGNVIGPKAMALMVALDEYDDWMGQVLAVIDEAATPPALDDLSAAWAEAEAALPPDHVLAELRRFDEGWSASTDNVTTTGRYHWSAEGPTPAAALRALAAALSTGDET